MMKDLKHNMPQSKKANCNSESLGLNAFVIINREINWHNMSLSEHINFTAIVHSD